MEIKKSDFVQSLEKGLRVIRTFGPDHSSMTVSEVAERSNLTRANARRLLLTLLSLGYMNCPDNKHYSLNPNILSLGYSYLSAMPMQELAQPFMQTMANTTNESCSLSVLEGTDIVYIARVQIKRIMTISLGVGTRLPVHATSMGKVLVSQKSEEELHTIFENYSFDSITPRTLNRNAFFLQLEKTRADGYAISDQELELGVRSIAVPVKNKNGEIVAALNMSGYATRVTLEELLPDYLPLLKSTAAEIEYAINRI